MVLLFPGLPFMSECRKRERKGRERRGLNLKETWWRKRGAQPPSPPNRSTSLPSAKDLPA